MGVSLDIWTQLRSQQPHERLEPYAWRGPTLPSPTHRVMRTIIAASSPEVEAGWFHSSRDRKPLVLHPACLQCLPS